MKLRWCNGLLAVIVALPVLLLLFSASRPARFAVGLDGPVVWSPGAPGMSGFAIILVFGLVGGWIITTWIRARFGYPLEDGMGNAVRKEKPREESLQTLKAELAARDERIASLEERVRVLERIATDRRSAIEEEFERLRT